MLIADSVLLRNFGMRETDRGRRCALSTPYI